MHSYHIITDADSTSLQYLFVSDPASNIVDGMYRDIIFEVIIASEICNRFDTCHKFWDKFGARKPFLHNCLGYFSIESTDNSCYLRIARNPKEYFEIFEKSEINKKHRGIKNGSSGMNFKNYASRIVSLTNFNYFEKAQVDYKEVARLTVNLGEMQRKTLLKNFFSQFTDKKFYFSDAVTSLPLFHLLLKAQAGHKKKGQSKSKAQEQNKRLLLYHQILMSAANYFLLHQKENFVEKKTQLIFKSTRDFVLEGLWMGTITTTGNSKSTSYLLGKPVVEKQRLY